MTITRKPLAPGPVQTPPVEAKTFTVEQSRADLKYLYSTLQEAHYDLFAYTRREVFEREYRRIEETLRGPRSLHDIHLLFQQFVALGNIGHSNIGFYFGEYAQDGHRLFPFDLIVRDGSVLIQRNYSADSRIVPGDRLLSMDGIPINAVMDEVRKYISGERPYLKDSVMEGFGFSRLWWFARGNRDAYSIQVKKAEGVLLSALVDAVPARTFDKERNQFPLSRYEREAKILDSRTAYLHPGPFFNFAGGKTYDDAAFLRFLESAFTEIAKSKVTNLIIDLRNNPGGNNSFSDPMIAYFARKSFRFCSKYSLKTSRALKEFWANEVPKTIDMAVPEVARMNRAIHSHRDGEKFPFAIADYPPRTDELRFRGKVYALVNRHSYSNATSAAAVIQDYGFGELIGEETSDVPTSYASGASFTLPNTGIQVNYPKGYFLRPNGDRKVKGVVPDYRVPEDPFDKGDAVLEFTLQHIKKARA